ncbi:hypothetical protein AAVH_30831 [Aphelenchoides avenae]|nr:hypothetical protein AAVH_30831 [Aphelenchus avenae]
MDPLVAQLANAIAALDSKNNGLLASILQSALGVNQSAANSQPAALAAPTLSFSSAPSSMPSLCSPSKDTLTIVAEALQRQQQQQQVQQQMQQQQRQAAEMVALEALLQQQLQGRQQAQMTAMNAQVLPVNPYYNATSALSASSGPSTCTSQTFSQSRMAQPTRQYSPNGTSTLKRRRYEDNVPSKRHRSEAPYTPSTSGTNYASNDDSRIKSFNPNCPLRHHPDNLPKRDPEACLLEDYATAYMLNGLSGVPQRQFQATLENALSELRSNSPPPPLTHAQSRTRLDSAYGSIASSRATSRSSAPNDELVIIDDDEITAATLRSRSDTIPAIATSTASTPTMNPSQMNAIRDFYANLVRSQTQNTSR